MINRLLNEMYHLNIQIKEIENKTKLVYEPGLLNDELKIQIIKNKKGILKRLEENEIAKKEGFLVFNHGQFYEYRYGRGAFMCIERLPDGLAAAWRDNYRQDQNAPYKTQTIVKNVPFSKAFEDAMSFIGWLKRKQGRRVG